MYQRVAWFVTCALLLVAMIGCVAIKKEAAYLEKNPFFYDAASYQYYNVILSTKLESTSRLALAWDEWLHNGRHPIQTVPLIILAPQLLRQQFSFMPMALTLLAVFLTLLMWTIYRRHSSVLVAIFTSTLVASLPMMYHPTYGLATYWLEWFPALCIACAILCLLNASRFGKYEYYWMIGFGLFTALGILGRYIALVLVLVLPFPVLLFYLIRRWRKYRSWKKLVQPLALAGIVFSVLAGYFLVAHFQENYHFYITYNVPLKNNDLVASYHFVLQTWLSFWTHGSQYWIGRWLIPSVAGAWLAVHLCFALKQRRWSWSEVGLAIWLIIGAPLVLIGTKILNATHPILLGVMTPVIAVATPLSYRLSSGVWKRLLIVLSFGWVGVAIVVLFMQRQATMNYQTTPEQLPKTLASDITAALQDRAVPHTIWNLYVDEYSNLPTLEAYYRTGQLFLPAGQPYFYADRYAWEADYSGYTPAQVAELIYQASNRWVNVAIVFADPDQARLNGWMNNEYSRTVADYMARQLPQDPQWQLTGQIENAYFGKLLVYKNTAVESANYNQALNSPLSIHPNPAVRADLTKN